MGKDSTPPPQPDYVGAAQAQGQANVQAAQTGAALNRVDTTTPYGALTYNQPDPNDPNKWTANVSLSPDQQKLLDAQTTGQLSKASDANGMLSQVQNTFATPFSAAGAPAAVTSLGSGPNLSMYHGSTAAPNSTVNTSGVTPIRGAGDWGANAQQAQDAAYAQETSMLDPQYKQQSTALAAQLEASGVAPGSEAYTSAMTNFNNQKATDYSNARNQSIAVGNNEQATLAGESMTANQQLYAQALSEANLGNNAQAQSFSEGASTNANNNATKQQEFANTQTAANFQNTARGASLAEQEALREIPLNEYNALATGTQVTQPNFNVGTAQVNAPAAAPIFAGTQAQAGGLTDIYNQQQATNNSNTQAGVGLASAAIMAYAF